MLFQGFGANFVNSYWILQVWKTTFFALTWHDGEKTKFLLHIRIERIEKSHFDTPNVQNTLGNQKLERREVYVFKTPEVNPYFTREINIFN